MAFWNTIIGALIWVTYFLPFVVLPHGLMALYKLGLGTVAKCKRGENGVDKLHFLDSMDCMLAPESGGKQSEINLGFVLIIEGRIGVERMREHFRCCFLNEISHGDRYEKLYSHLECFGGYVFRATAETLDINEHIVEAEPISTAELTEFLVNWDLKEWQSLKPCWKLAVIPLNGGERTGIAFKIHHALADKYSLLHILDKLTDSSSPSLVKGFEQGGLTQLRQIVEGPGNLGKMMGIEPSKNPFRVTLNPEQKERESLVVFSSVKLKEMENLCKKYGVKMDSILLTIISGALRKFLEEEEKDGIAEEFCVQITLPWPKHPSQQASSSNTNKLCNHWVGLNIKVPLREPNPELRIKGISVRLHELQAELGLDKFFGRVMLPLMWAFPRCLIEKAHNEECGVGATLDSVVGAEEGYTLLGKEATDIHFWSESTDSKASPAFGCISFSHRGKLELTFDGHSSVFKDQERFNHLCQKLIPDELDALLRIESASDLNADCIAVNMV